jgi:hypothetical protein
MGALECGEKIAVERLSIPRRLICLWIYSLTRCTVMTSANFMSILKSWSGYAAAALVRLKALAPYALIELILPGGSVIALLLWLYRRRENGIGFGPMPVKLLVFPRLQLLRVLIPPCAVRSVQ